jgi:hypothetical protein
MTAPTRGDLTSETQIDVYWTAIQANSLETGGSPIDSYNLQWMIKDSIVEFEDLHGQDGDYTTIT